MTIVGDTVTGNLIVWSNAPFADRVQSR